MAKNRSDYWTEEKKEFQRDTLVGFHLLDVSVGKCLLTEVDKPIY